MNFKKIALLVVVIGLVITQFLVKKDNVSSYESIAEFEKMTAVPENLKPILRAKCYDCHSNHTVYPWYASIGPVNLFLNHHIEEGREHLDLSNWANYPERRQNHKLGEIYHEVEEGEMPLQSYTWTHGGLTATEKEAVLGWTQAYKDM